MQDVIFNDKKPNGGEKMALLSKVTGFETSKEICKHRMQGIRGICTSTDLQSKLRFAVVSVSNIANAKHFIHLFLTSQYFIWCFTVLQKWAKTQLLPVIPLYVYTKAEFPLSKFSTPLFKQEPLIKLCSSQQQSYYNWLTAGENT